MVGWILLLVVLALVLLACVLRLGVAAGYEEGGGWVKVHLGPKWVSLYPVPQARTARRRKKQRRKEAKAEATEDQKDREKFSLGGALDLALELLPQVKAAAGKFRRALRVDGGGLRGRGTPVCRGGDHRTVNHGDPPGTILRRHCK